ncbi:MAG: YlmC/YmxH family sporulation protein [Thermoanaerobacterales bacterium]|jgi:YlmC/YmxH family sporulation protein|nr:YlmC/YmxH family sporulation protein [Thermoanaerobacterales bacterium]
MRLSELGGKEIVNLYDGERLGIIGSSDLVIDSETGKIAYLLIPRKKNPFLVFSDRNVNQVPWEAIKKVGSDLVIVEVQNKVKR